jgi:ketosteroid isomerase-like protein
LARNSLLPCDRLGRESGNLYGMDAATVKAMLEQHFELARSDPDRAHEMYTDDAVLEFPQSGERFEGVDNFREWRSNYPDDTSFKFSEVRGADDVWVAELTVSYGGSTPNFGVSILQLRGKKISRETIYVGDGWEAPEWRARWRAAP